ncbi:MAG: hypothetical protein JWN13_5022 [Betaproteobacteria bacterium]|nr:hypothetical protein [Betaproteobacteria bacterium]
MRGGDEPLQVIGSAIGCFGCELQDAVITPVVLAGELSNGHELDRSHAKRSKIVKPPLDAGERPVRRESAHVSLVDHRFRPWAPAPCTVAPFK